MENFTELFEEYKNTGDLSKLDKYILLEMFNPNLENEIEQLSSYINKNRKDCSAYIDSVSAFNSTRFNRIQSEIHLSNAKKESKSNPQSSFVIVTLYRAEAYSYYCKGELKNSYSLIEKGLKLAKTDGISSIISTFIYFRGLLFISLGKYEKALNEFVVTLVSQDAPLSDASINKYIALCHMAIGNYSSAKSTIDLIFKGNFNDKVLNENFYNLYLLHAVFTDDYEEAQNIHRRLEVINKNTTFPIFISTYAEAKYYLYMNNYLKAYSIYKNLFPEIYKERTAELRFLNEYCDILFRLNKIYLAYDIKTKAYNTLNENLEISRILEYTKLTNTSETTEYQNIMSFLNGFSSGILLEYEPISLLTYIEKQLKQFFKVNDVCIILREDDSHLSCVKNNRKQTFDLHPSLYELVKNISKNELTIVRNNEGEIKRMVEQLGYDSEYTGIASIFFKDEYIGTVNILADEISNLQTNRFDYLNLIISNISLNIKNTVSFLNAKENSQIDQLTNVKNETAFKIFKQTDFFDPQTYLLYFDIININEVVSNYSFKQGDALLTKVAMELKKIFNTENIFRLSKSRFLVAKVLSKTKVQSDAKLLFNNLKDFKFGDEKEIIDFDMAIAGNQVESNTFEEAFRTVSSKLEKVKVQLMNEKKVGNKDSFKEYKTKKKKR